MLTPKATTEIIESNSQYSGCANSFNKFVSSWCLRPPASLTTSCVRRKLSWGGFIQWHVVVICIWCTLFVTSPFDVILIFPNNVLAKFVDIICTFFYTHSLYFMRHCTEYRVSALQARISKENTMTLPHSSSQLQKYCIRLRVKTG